MDDVTRKFFLEKINSRRNAIVDVVGNLGNWPFRRTISYHVGVNCDSIEATNGFMRVRRRGRVIAVAELPPPAGLLRRFLRWSVQLLHPRHASGTATAQSAPQWEDLVRPRKRR